jgi:RimJ/RimL family protein N-acetyltransferase
MIEFATDPESIRFTTVPTPYGPDDARAFLQLVADGWRRGDRLGWAIELDDRTGRFAGSIDLRLEGDGVAEVGFGLHPAARGRGMMSAALRLVRDHAFDVRGLRLLRWRAVVGNWGSRRVAAAAGFRFDGRVRQLLNHRGELLDGWLATITAEDPRTPLGWLEPPALSGERVVLRPLGERDLGRIAEACGDVRSRHWLVSLPTPYTLADAWGYLEGTRELAAAADGLTWCIADPDTNVCLGSISLEGYANYARRGEIGYWAHPDARGRGVVTEAVRLVSGYADRSGLAGSIQIRCAAGNRASRHVAESAGYVRVGAVPAAEPLGDGTIDDLLTYVRPPAAAR